MISIIQIKKDFPIFSTHPELVYLDSAAMSLKPKQVIDAVNGYYSEYSANVFRGIYALSEKATAEYEKVRNKVAIFINAHSQKEIIFVRNTTEAINLVAYSWGEKNIGKQTEIITTIMEHHSNFIPWQQLCLKKGGLLKVINVDETGVLDEGQLERAVTKDTRLLAITYVSNALGTINPLKKIIRGVKRKNPHILVLVDAAQAVPHLPVDVQDLGCDFFTFSGQKMLGPTGAGILWGKYEILKNMPPFLYGGEMMKEVYLDKTVFSDPPHRFEAGTPHIAGVIGLGAAIDYLNNVGMDNIRSHEQDLISYAIGKLEKIKGLTLYGSKNIKIRSGVLTFSIKGIHPHDIAQILDEGHICVRSGHHCAMPLHIYLKQQATVRATFYLYNSKQDVDRLVAGVERVIKLFS